MSALSTGIILATSETESFPQDDIDRLFNKLQKLEPPEDIVKKVLARVKNLHVSQPQSNAEQGATQKQHEAAE